MRRSVGIQLYLGKYLITELVYNGSSPPPFYEMALFEGLSMDYKPMSEEEAMQPVPLKRAIFKMSGPGKNVGWWKYHLTSIEGE